MLSDAWIPFISCVVVAMAASYGIHIELLAKTCHLQHLEQTRFYNSRNFSPYRWNDKRADLKYYARIRFTPVPSTKRKAENSSHLSTCYVRPLYSQGGNVFKSRLDLSFKGFLIPPTVVLSEISPSFSTNIRVRPWRNLLNLHFRVGQIVWYVERWPVER